MKAHINIIVNDTPTHLAACLVQGFNQLGLEVFSNNDFSGVDSRGISAPFSQTDRSFINVVPAFTEGPILIDLRHPYDIDNYTPQLNKIGVSRPIGFLNMMDWANYTDYDDRFVAFTCHLNSYLQRSGRIFPIGFGLSEDIIRRSDIALQYPKQNVVIKNFNPTFRQSVRESLELSFVENLKKVVNVDCTLTNDNLEQYAHQLSGAAAVCAYCGDFVSDYMSVPYFKETWERDNNPLAKQFTFKNFRGPVEIARFDSWRFYEACVYGCAPITLDFDKYGLTLPVNPVPWEHYVPIDFANVNSLAAKIQRELDDNPDYLAAIGRRARTWALANYSPKAVASYVLEKLGV